MGGGPGGKCNANLALSFKICASTDSGAENLATVCVLTVSFTYYDTCDI